MSLHHTAKSRAFDDSGRLLVLAPPILAGFQGAPIALSHAKLARRPKSTLRRNWARRRAYHG